LDKTSHKEHEGREDHKGESGVYVRYLIVKLTHGLRTETFDPLLCDLCTFVIFVRTSLEKF